MAVTAGCEEEELEEEELEEEILEEEVMDQEEKVFEEEILDEEEVVLESSPARGGPAAPNLQPHPDPNSEPQLLTPTLIS